MATTAFTLDGDTMVDNLGLVRDVAARSGSALAWAQTAFHLVFGGALSQITNLTRKVREDALNEMRQQAAATGADAIIGVRYTTSEIQSGFCEAICYSSAVKAQPAGVHA